MESQYMYIPDYTDPLNSIVSVASGNYFNATYHTKIIPLPHSFEFNAFYNPFKMTDEYAVKFRMDHRYYKLYVSSHLVDMSTQNGWAEMLMAAMVNHQTYKDSPEEARLVFLERFKQALPPTIPVSNLNGNWPIASNAINVSKETKKLPAVDKTVESPCESPCEESGLSDILWNVIQHLNDEHKWSREKIADWIDMLHDNGIINAEFESWNEPEGDS